MNHRINYLLKYSMTNITCWCIGAVMLLFAMSSCSKKGENDYAPMSHPIADTAGDIRNVLAKSPFTLFKQAYAKASIDSFLPAINYFTIFAPTDSAMKAAGLDAGTINSLSKDSLRKIILYHIVNGSLNDGALSSAICSIEANSLRQDITYDPIGANAFVYQQNLYIKKSGMLYINGEPMTNPQDTAYSASNGFVWPIKSVLVAPTQTLWKIINSRPELNMYLMALHINDSLYKKKYGFGINGSSFNSVAGDSFSFSRMVYENQPQSFFYGRVKPTVFAPTNKAFNDAGFYTYSDLLKFALQSEPGVTFDDNWNMIRHFPNLDSLLKLHLIINKDNKYTNMSLYNDFLFNPDMSNGSFNNCIFWQGQDRSYSGGGYVAVSPQPVYPLQFSNTNGTANLKWNPNVASAVLPPQKDRHLMALNGVLYEIDKLFLPHL